MALLAPRRRRRRASRTQESSRPATIAVLIFAFRKCSPEPTRPPPTAHSHTLFYLAIRISSTCRYARLVPLHSREGYNSFRSNGQSDKRNVFVNGKAALEYDGLKNGELAWILGRRFKSISPDLGGAGSPPALGTTGIDELTDSQRYAHQAYAGLGNGVDRMQRLASTDWVESLVQSKLGTAKINLHAIKLGSDYSIAMDSGVASYAPFLTGSTALYANDVTRSMLVASGNTTALTNLGPRKNQGIFVAELGPFLRGIQVSADAIEIRSILGTSASQDVARNMGDTLCFSSLDAELRRRNLMDWTPDGIVLSKLESPTDEPMKSIEMDSRSAQLFNVAIQGPAISTSWTSDVRDYKLECQPMDRVFICLVADLSYSTDNGKMSGPVASAIAARARLDSVIKSLDVAYQARPLSQPAVAAARQVVNEQLSICKAAGDAIADAADSMGFTKYEELLDAATTAEADFEAGRNKQPRPDKAKLDDLEKAATDARKAVDRAMDGWDMTNLPGELQQYADHQEEIRLGVKLVGRASLTNFRLMRSTSSHMSNYSHFKPGNSNSRMGLRLGKSTGGSPECGEYIVGAWCIGTVIDSAASRSTVGTLVRTAPTSMALNVAVNIEWWTGDKLYKHYMDDSGMTRPRGIHSGNLMAIGAGGTKRTRAAADIDTPAPGVADEPPTYEERAEQFGDDFFKANAPGGSELPGQPTVPSSRRAGGPRRSA